MSTYSCMEQLAKAMMALASLHEDRLWLLLWCKGQPWHQTCQKSLPMQSMHSTPPLSILGISLGARTTRVKQEVQEAELAWGGPKH